MKKVIIATIALAFTAYTHAQTGTDTSAVTINTALSGDTRTLVNISDLPEAVKTTLASEAYAGWKPNVAYWVESTTTKNAYYEIELTKGEDRNTIKLDKAGQPVK